MSSCYDIDMRLVGMFDSPFVRRVAISMDVLGLPFSHANLSVGKDFDLICASNPLGRVPVLELDDGSVVIDSATILDFLDDRVGTERALLPASGPPRRTALHIVTLALGAAEKGIQVVGEDVFRPAAKRHEPWVTRCRTQVENTLAHLERIAHGADGSWLLGDRISQADITLGCAATYLREAARVDFRPYPALLDRSSRYDSLPPFQKRYARFDAPVA